MFQILFLNKTSSYSRLLISLCVFSCFCFFIAACGTEKLTREDAAKLIAAHKKIANEGNFISLNSEAPNNGSKLEFWTRYANNINLSKKGQKYFSKVSETFVFSGSYRAKLVSPVAIDVEVTGITDAPANYGGYQVNFSWYYLNLPPAIKTFAINGGAGNAYLKKYDDGWRIEELEYDLSTEPIKLTDEEIAKEKQEIAEITEAKKKEADRFSRLVEKSKTEEKIIGKFTLLDDHDKNYLHTTKITITDVNFTHLSTTKTKTQEWVNGKEKKIWFGHVGEIKRKTHSLKKFTQYEIEIFDGNHNIKENVISTNKNELDELFATLLACVTEWRQKHAEILKRMTN